MAGTAADDELLLELPRQQARRRLVAALANLLKNAGWERFVTHPVLLPKTAYFPDRWNRSARGAYRLVRRLMVYAGLEGDATVHVFKTTEGDTHVDAEAAEYPLGPEHALATFHGKADEGYVFGIDVKYLGDDEMLVGAMCHEVAHAFRATHDLEVATTDVEEQLTDLTTIFLGFGVLTTNNTHRVRTGGGVSGAMAWSETNLSTAGYLGPGDMAFLLAVHAVVRERVENPQKKETARIAKHLEANQAAMFTQAVDELRPRREELIAELELPLDEASWPAPAPLEPFLRTLDMTREREFDGEPPRTLHGRGENRGNAVFRVRYTRSLASATASAAMAVVVAVLLDVTDATVLCVVAACSGAAGAAAGRRFVYYECSDSKCEARLERWDEQCPRCGGSVRGTIASAQHRLEALEALDQGTFRSLD